MNDSHRRPGWKHTVARRALSAVHKKQIKCIICADIGFVIDNTKMPITSPCPHCQSGEFEYREDEMFPFATSRHTLTD